MVQANNFILLFQCERYVRHPRDFHQLSHKICSTKQLFQTPCGSSFYKGLHNLPTSTPFVGRAAATPGGETTTLHGSTLSAASRASSGIGSSGISSIHGSLNSRDPTPVPQSLPPRWVFLLYMQICRCTAPPVWIHLPMYTMPLVF